MRIPRRHFVQAGLVSATTPFLATPLSEAARSQDGLLDTLLDVRPATAFLGSRATTFWGYQGLLPGPVLEARAGDAIRLRLHNSLPEPTNLHFHGLHVSPEGRADNPFIEIPPGEQFDYEIQIPANHPAGAFWYHPHMHGAAARQLFRGLAGMILVRGNLDRIPEVAAAPEQLAVLQDITVDRRGEIVDPTPGERILGREGSTQLVNGEIRPMFWIQRGGLLRLRFLNASCSRYHLLEIEDHPMAILALDGGSLAAPLWTRQWLLTPGQRMDLLVAGQRPAGSYRILSQPYNRGSMGMMGAAPRLPLQVASLNYSGSAGREVPIPETLVDVETLGEASVQRRFVLTEGMMGSFQINGRSFRPERTDTQVRLGVTEDWVIENRGAMDHPFHVHVNPFQPVGSGGVPQPVWLDVINVPRGASARIRIRFDDFPGRTLYHCHILDHEDMGMMGTMEIRDPV